MGLESILVGMGSKEAAMKVLDMTKKHLAKRKKEADAKPKTKKKTTFKQAGKDTMSAIERRNAALREAAKD
jgi:hypothetical protein